MLIPAFNITQNENFLLLKIKAPYTKISETEIFFEGTDFRFYSKPYFLRLCLPGRVNETGGECASYNVEEGSYSIQIPKACPGEWFEGLDLQTRLLTPKGKISARPLVEVLDIENDNPSTAVDEVDDDEFNWEIYKNQFTEEDAEDLYLDNVKYGFASQKTDASLFSRIQEEMPDLLDVRVQNHITAMQREKRYEKEEGDFSEEHYFADLYETEEISRLSIFKPSWSDLEAKKINSPTVTLEELVVFSEEEKCKMRNLPKKEYLFDQPTKQKVLLSLVDILYAYAYNVRTTEGENTVESAWTICKLSSTLSWLETFSSLESVVVSSVRRSLCYPLFRHWKLALIVLSDTVKILSLGPRYVLKCLLEIHSLFNESEPRYILNDLYITDYCVWIQTVKSKVLLDLSEALKKVSISKECLGLDLPELEEAAELVMKGEESKTSEELSKKLCELDLKSTASQTEFSSESSDQCSECRFESSESESDSDSSDDESSSSLDSDDFSSSENDDSSDDDDADSDPNEGSAENCLLLGNVHSLEKIR